MLQLDAGESEAIQLAQQNKIELILMDDAEGRREAIRRNLRVAGTLSIIEKASQQGLVNFHHALAKLDRTSFRLSLALRQEFLKRNS